MTKRRIDLNADMGEFCDDAQRDAEAALMMFISSCSIACGGHAGDADTMRATARLAKMHGVRAGAHPAYPDREGFGRRSISIALSELSDALEAQLDALAFILEAEGMPMAHLKPHGALYNDAAKTPALAAVIARCARARADAPILVGPPGSALEEAARNCGVAFAAEGFIDRLYQSSGALTPRTMEGAVINDVAARVEQARAIAARKPFKAVDGTIELNVETLCIHSDSPGAVETAREVRMALEADGFEIRPF